MRAHGVPAECAQIMQRQLGWHRYMLSSETLYDIKKGFVKQQELTAVVHISLIAAVSFLMPPHLSHHHSSSSFDVSLPGQQHKPGYRRFPIHAKCFPVVLQ